MLQQFSSIGLIDTFFPVINVPVIFLCRTLPSNRMSSNINMIKKVIMENNCNDTHIRYDIS